MLVEARIGWWQMLPLTAPGDGNSPYNGSSAFAGNPLLISLDGLVEDGWLRRQDIPANKWPPGRVDFARVARFKHERLALAWERFNRGADAKHRLELAAFRRRHSHWLEDYSLFSALQDMYHTPWNTWPKKLARRDSRTLEKARHDLADAIDRHCFIQFIFYRQLAALRTYTKKKNVRFIGDMPIFVSYDSADVWAQPHLFQLDRSRNCKVVAGVPPDYFCVDGQLWGNPHYHWKAMAADGFRWWINRAKTALKQVHLVRLDHFRGFEAYWAVPARSLTARNGRWIKALGAEFFKKLRHSLGGLPFIAEDLGLITPGVEKLRDDLHLPGMRVMQFAFGDSPDNPFLPHNYSRNGVAYTGTHDNDTTIGWYRHLSVAQRRFLHQYAPAARHDVADELIRLAWGSVVDLAIAPLQDVLGLDSRARMNTPGVATGNWTWRATERQLRHGVLNRIAELTRIYSRQTVATGVSA
jgi:4-alpha-glucanotransferase